MGTHWGATLESQHQYCSAEILSKIKVWHKKDRPYDSHPRWQIKIFPTFTFILKTALYSKWNCTQEGWYHFPIWIPTILPGWVSRCFANAPWTVPCPTNCGETRAAQNAHLGLRVDFNLRWNSTSPRAFLQIASRKIKTPSKMWT